MKTVATYSVHTKGNDKVLKATTQAYRQAVDYFIGVCITEWDYLSQFLSAHERQVCIERFTVATSANPNPPYDFASAEKYFYKFPSYLRRAAITEAIGKVSSYRSNLENWENADPETRGKKPGLPVAGFIYPALYRDNMFVRTGDLTAQVKVFVRNTWDWITIPLRKCDVDYIRRHCAGADECAPTLQRRGKVWSLDFAFKRSVPLSDTEVMGRTILAVDLGVNNACVCTAMRSDGTILGREFLSLPREEDSLTHAVNRIKKAQQHGAKHMPRLWGKVNGINEAIARKTVQFIILQASRYQCDVIVMEHLDMNGKIRGSKRQRLSLWKKRRVARLVEGKAHAIGMRFSTVNPWNTSRLAFDGSGLVQRGEYEKNGRKVKNYSMCLFQNGKEYNCDLNASYNIGARYFIREILKSLPERVRLGVEAKVPQLSKRSTCTYTTLVSLNAELKALVA